MNTILKFFTLLIFTQNLVLNAQIKLPKLVSDGIVLQRDQPIKIWGWAAPNEHISINFKSENYSTKANNNGKWTVNLPAQTFGGPFTMTLKASNTITINDILIGDVWVCSGQSNMELTMNRVSDKYQNVIDKANYPEIRQFLVPDRYNFNNEAEDFEFGEWIDANPESVMDFSAVAFFFAQNIYEKHHIPIGLINSALGGSPVESWISEGAIKTFPEAFQEALKFKDQKLIDSIIASDKQRIDGWYSDLNSKDEGLLASPQWQTKNIDDTSWNSMELPGYWKGEPIGNINGSVWFRKTIEIPEHMAGKPAKLMLGRIVDQDFVYVNGEFVGTTGYQYPPRRYHVKPNILKTGTNNVTVRVINNIGNGGFVLDKPYYLATETDTIQLNGRWKYKVGTKMSPLESQTFIRWKPVGLYNAMIAPLLNLKIKGVIWYQGESNTKNPKSYFKTFPTLIENWRNKWQQGNFPFLYVQLTNFMETKSEPVESSWAELRQAQLETLKVPKTGMAVAIDLGEWNDIHPLNKKDVGDRLALLARKMTYGETDLKASSPIPKQVKFKKDKVVITFKNAEGGLQSINGKPLKTFSISNDGKHFVWAKAEIKDNQVIVWHDSISQPKIVRYAWSDNPDEANLFSKNHLPASPFQIKKEN